MRIRVHTHLQMLPVTAANFQTNYRDGVLCFFLCIYLSGYNLCLVSDFKTLYQPGIQNELQFK